MERFDFKLNAQGDIEIEDNNLAFSYDRDVYVQCLRQILSTRKGEYFLNIDEGLDHSVAIGNKNPDEEQMFDALYIACMQVEQFVEIDKVIFNYDQSKREVDVKMEVYFSDLNDEGEKEIAIVQFVMGGEVNG